MFLELRDSKKVPFKVGALELTNNNKIIICQATSMCFHYYTQLNVGGGFGQINILVPIQSFSSKMFDLTYMLQVQMYWSAHHLA